MSHAPGKRIRYSLAYYLRRVFKSSYVVSIEACLAQVRESFFAMNSAVSIDRPSPIVGIGVTSELIAWAEAHDSGWVSARWVSSETLLHFCRGDMLLCLAVLRGLRRRVVFKDDLEVFEHLILFPGTWDMNLFMRECIDRPAYGPFDTHYLPYELLDELETFWAHPGPL